jgi:exopolyphosphatase/guanosine-5'-triphosphate,3'-diphosphate pyrophosphatase
VGSIGDILVAMGYSAHDISRKGLAQIKELLQKAGRMDRVRLDGLKEDRRAVLCGGLSVLCALFDLLGIDTLLVADGALRQGVLYDMVDREYNATDVRSSTVARMASTFRIDTIQANRVAKIASHLFSQVISKQDLTVFDRLERKLAWAAQLHEIGTHISHTDYHKHGAYVLEHVDAVGFAQHELHRLGLLVLGHKGKLKKLGDQLNEMTFACQLLALRLAVIACHARTQSDWSGVRLSCAGNIFALQAPSSWQQTHPQSIHLLKQEAEAWQKSSWLFELKFKD